MVASRLSTPPTLDFAVQELREGTDTLAICYLAAREKWTGGWGQFGLFLQDVFRL